MAYYSLQTPIGGTLHAKSQKHALWDYENAHFTEYALPWIAGLPLLAISIITASHCFRYCFPRAVSQWRPRWMLPFVPEECSKEGELPSKDSEASILWANVLTFISVLAVMAQLVELLTHKDVRVHTILLLVSWTLAALVVATRRPRYCPASLLTFYVPALIAELSGTWTSSKLQITAHHLVSFLILVSIAVILLMPLRPISPSSGPISGFGTAPNNLERSPEDALRLWQFLTVSWAWPLLAIGKERQMEKDDFWKLSYQFQNGRLARAFRELQGSTVFRRLLTANAIDCCILTLTAFVQLICEFASPLLLHQLLLVMESPERRKQPALTYALLLLARGFLSAQTSTLAMWFERRCYERSKGELIMMIYEKTMSRKVIVGLEKKKDETNGGPVFENGNESTATGTAKGSASEHANGHADQTDKKATAGDPKAPKDAKKEEAKKDRAAKFKLFKELFWGSKETEEKKKGPASTGQILNLVRTDAYEIAQRFREIKTLIRMPFGIIFAVIFVWKLLGPSCFIAIIFLVVAHFLNGLITRLRVRWRRVGKVSTDARVQINSQYIDVIRHLRWYAWEETWLKKVMDARQHELNVRIISMLLNILVYFITVFSGALFPVAAFFAYTALAGHELRIDLIFPALQLFDGLKSRMREIPQLITNLLNAYVAMERIEDFMAEPGKEGLPEPDEEYVQPTSATSLEMKDCSFAWPGTSGATLRDINLVMEPGLTVVYGKIGSGKTALLNAILGEMDKVSGDYKTANEIMGYCSQTPWLQSMSIRDNILFFSPYDEKRYEQVLDTCALPPDLANFKDGDLSHIGENGIGLSGGQRARVALARALYSRAQILLLDDPLSALDFHTAESIVRKFFSGSLMKDRTVVLVTHRTSLVHDKANLFVEIIDGNIAVSSDDPFLSADGSSDKEEDPKPETPEPEVEKQKGKTDGAAPQTFIEEEHREHGGVKAKVWLTFVKAGKFWWIFLFAMMALTRVFNVAQQWFFKSWGEAYDDGRASHALFVQTGVLPHAEWASFQEVVVKRSFSFDPRDYLPSPRDNLRPWLIVLVLVSTGQSLSLLMYAISQLTAVYATSKAMFAQAMRRITHATFRFYDVTPTGRLMNRLTSDIQVLDNALNYFGATIFFTSAWISSVIVIASISPIFLLFSAALMGVFVIVFMQFLPASRSLKRLETVSLSPLYTIFGELLESQGLITVRAFHAQQAFEERVVGIVDQFQGLGHYFWCVQNWLLYRYENISALSVFSLTAIALATDLPPGMTAFMLVNAENFIYSTHTLCIRFGELQTEFISVERIVELLEIEQEPEGTLQPPASWPRFGSEIIFDKVSVRYAEHLEPSLIDITLHIPGGSTTAIIGRTGSGKSTLATALLNIVRAETGVITIDNVALTDINVETLRRRVTFVAQDPVLFLGTIRQNLDPIDEFSDTECAAVLDRVCSNVTTTPWTLNTHVEGGGRNFSQGQRQLLGIARAVLRRSPIVILDEATASIDVSTSMELQNILREELAEATIITIAHRVEAVKGADYYVVLENGRVLREGPVESDFVVEEGGE